MVIFQSTVAIEAYTVKERLNTMRARRDTVLRCIRPTATRPRACFRSLHRMAEILVLFYSRKGSTAELARQVCRGIESVAGAKARLRTVPPVATVIDQPQAPVPADGPPYATHDDLRECDGLVL